jgi:DNA-binding SARP family transcriptional activator
MHALRLLGSVALEGFAGPVSGYAAQPRQLALLAMLAAAGRDGLSRDKLLACLWPEATTESARHSLADAIYRLRKELGPDTIEGAATTIRLNPRVVESDVVVFENAVEADDPAAAAALYHGPFLDGFHLRDVSEFEYWKEAEARKLDAKAQSALDTLAGRAEAAGDHAQATHWLSRLLALDPFNSRTVLRLMDAHASAGDPANALRLAAEHSALLDREVGVEPPAALQARAERLRARAEPPHVRHPLASPAARAARALPFEVSRASTPALEASFAGREPELARLHATFDRALAGEGRVASSRVRRGRGRRRSPPSSAVELPSGSPNSWWRAATATRTRARGIRTCRSARSWTCWPAACRRVARPGRSHPIRRRGSGTSCRSPLARSPAQPRTCSTRW